MSYSIIQQPEENTLQYSNGEIISVVEQSDYDPDSPEWKDFKFWADVYVNGEKKVRLKSFPEPLTDKGVFNLKNIASAFTKWEYVFSSSDIFQQSPNSACELQLYYGEERNNNGSWTSESQATGNTFISLNAAPWKDDAALSQYVIDNYEKLFLNKAKELKTSAVFGDQYLFFYNKAGEYTPAAKIEICTFTNSVPGDWSSLKGIYRVDNSYSDASGVQCVNVGVNAMQKINDESLYTKVYGDDSFFDSGVKRWNVCMIYSGAEKATDYVEIVLDTSCYRYPEPIIVYWLNNLGAFDQYIFNSKNIISTTKKAQSFTKQAGKLVGSSYVNNSYDQTKVNYFTELQDTIEITANWLSDDDVKLLKSLVMSPIVFFKGTDNVMYSASIDANDYKLSYRKFQKKYDLTLKLIPSTSYNSQLQ